MVNRPATAPQFTDLSVNFGAKVLNRDAIRIGESFNVDIKLFISPTTLLMSPGKLRRLIVAPFLVPASVAAVAHDARTSTINFSPKRRPGSGSLANPAPTTSFTEFVEFLGASVINLAPVMFHPKAGGGMERRVTLEYLATKGNLAIVLVNKEVDVSMSVEDGEVGAGGEAKILNEWSAVREVWVMS